MTMIDRDEYNDSFPKIKYKGNIYLKCINVDMLDLSHEFIWQLHYYQSDVYDFYYCYEYFDSIVSDSGVVSYLKQIDENHYDKLTIYFDGYVYNPDNHTREIVFKKNYDEYLQQNFIKMNVNVHFNPLIYCSEIYLLIEYDICNKSFDKRLNWKCPDQDISYDINVETKDGKTYNLTSNIIT